MDARRLMIAIGAPLVGVAALGFGVAAARGGGDDQPLTGATLERASAAALAHTGGGQVTEAELGDAGAAYDVAVRLPDGSQVEVRLDAAFNVIGQEADHDGPGDSADDGGADGETDDDGPSAPVNGN